MSTSIDNPNQPCERGALCPQPVALPAPVASSAADRGADASPLLRKAILLPEIARPSLEGHSSQAIGRELGVPRRIVDRWLRQQRQQWARSTKLTLSTTEKCTMDLESAREQLEWTKKQKAEVDETLRLIETPVDFNQLCEDGLLERIGPTRFKIPNPKRLPPAAAAKLRTTVTEKSTRTGTKTSAKKVKCVGEFWSKADLKKMRTSSRLLGESSKLLGEIINSCSK